MRHIALCLISVLAVAFGVHLSAKSLYFVGGFNDWNINAPATASSDEGVLKIFIDFSKDNSFKMSAANPEGNWKTFDSATLFPVGDTKADEWFDIAETPTSPNIKAPEKREFTVMVDLDNMKMMFSTGGEAPAPWSGTLPVMFIETAGHAPVVSKDDYVAATYWLDPMGAEGIDAIGSAEAPLDLQIKGRGNYTWIGFDKKPYRLKLDKKAALMGMDKNKHFALLAHADDKCAGLRNLAGFTASEAAGLAWTPATAPLEVVLNGDYIGLYWLTETIRVDKDRVEVTEQADGATTDVDGGWLVEIDNYNTDPHVTVTDTGGHPIWFTYKSPEVLSAEQESYLKTQMQKIQDAVSGGNVSAAAGLVDFNALARYFLVNQVMLDMESFHGSCYLHRQRGAGETWKFGPVWDFGNAFAPARADKPRFIFDRPDFSQVWIGEFYAMDSFVSSVRNAWFDFLPDGPDAIKEKIEETAANIAAAAQSDAKRWPQYAHADVISRAAELCRYIDGSIEWLKGQWGESSISQVSDDSFESVATAPGALVVTCLRPTEIEAATIDGRLITLHAEAGRNVFSLPAGVYVVRHNKYLISDR